MTKFFLMLFAAVAGVVASLVAGIVAVVWWMC